MMTEQPAQVLLPIETRESEKFSIGLAHPFRINTVSWNNLNIQLTIVHSKQDI